KGLQAFLGRGMPIEMDVKQFQGGLQSGDVGLGGVDFRLLGRADELRNDGSGQNTENDDDHHDFDQSESGQGASRMAFAQRGITALASTSMKLFPFGVCGYLGPITPLTPALSPLRGEGERVARLFNIFARRGLRRFGDGLERTRPIAPGQPAVSPSPLTGRGPG